MPFPLKGGDYVLVLRTGAVFILGAQIALASGATVIATSSSNAKLEIAKKLCVQHLINYNTNLNWEDEVLKITGGRGVDHIIEVGGPNTIPKVHQGGQIFRTSPPCWICGRGDGSIPILATIHKAITSRDFLIGSIKQFEDMNRLFMAHQIRPVVDKVFPFKAYSYPESQRHMGKVVIKVTKNWVRILRV